MAEKLDVKSTLNLPQTSFSMKATLAQKEPEMIRKWEDERLYEQILRSESRASRRSSSTTARPTPTATSTWARPSTRSSRTSSSSPRRMQGIPGALRPRLGLPRPAHRDPRRQAARATRKRTCPLIEIREECRKYALKFIDIQRERVQAAGRLRRVGQALPDHEPGYEAEVLRYLAAFFASGNVYKGKRPVHWCLHCKTALAEAEIEYKDKTSPSIYVKFPVVSDLSQKYPRPGGPEGLCHHLDDDALDAAGQPGHRLPPRATNTRPARRAAETSTSWPSGSCPSWPKSSGWQESKVLATFPGRTLEGLKARHPFDRPRIALRPGRLRHPRGRDRAPSTRRPATAMTTT